MSAASITVTDLRLHVVTEKREIEAARPTAAIERELRTSEGMFSISLADRLPVLHHPPIRA